MGEATLDAGDSLSLADTIGTATPHQIFDLCSNVIDSCPGVEVTLHLHNTRGLAIANAMSGISAGIRRLDASVGGIGGCPYARATGNVCTEDLVHALIFDGYQCAVDLDGLIAVSCDLQALLSDPLPGLVHLAGSRQQCTPSGRAQITFRTPVLEASLPTTDSVAGCRPIKLRISDRISIDALKFRSM